MLARHRVAHAGAAAFHALGVGGQPAVDKAGHAQAQRHRFFGLGVLERLQSACVVQRADHHKGLTLGLEGMQIEQHIVPGHQRAQPVGNVVFEFLRCVGRRQVAVQVAVAVALLALMGQWVGDGHQRQAAAQQLQPAFVELGQHAAYAMGAGQFVAVHSAQHQQPGAGRDGLEMDGLEVVMGAGHGDQTVGLWPLAYPAHAWLALPCVLPRSRFSPLP